MLCDTVIVAFTDWRVCVLFVTPPVIDDADSFNNKALPRQYLRYFRRSRISVTKQYSYRGTERERIALGCEYCNPKGASGFNNCFEEFHISVFLKIFAQT